MAGTITLLSSQPTIAAIVNTNPKQLRFLTLADEAYNIRINYVQVPTAITAGDQTLVLQEEWHELLYLKFVEKVANSLGADDIELKFSALYDKQLRKDMAHVRSQHLKVSKLPFRWI